MKILVNVSQNGEREDLGSLFLELLRSDRVASITQFPRKSVTAFYVNLKSADQADADFYAGYLKKQFGAFIVETRVSAT